MTYKEFHQIYMEIERQGLSSDVEWIVFKDLVIEKRLKSGEVLDVVWSN